SQQQKQSKPPRENRALAKAPVKQAVQPQPKPEATVESGQDQGADDQGAGEGEGEGSEGAQQQQPKMVRLEALQQERNTNKELNAQIKAEREARAVLENRTNQILALLAQQEQTRQAAAQPQPQAEKIPDINEDPAGWVAATMQQTGRTLQEVQNELAQRKQAEQQASQVQRIISNAAHLEAQFKSTTPDYDAAAGFLLESRKKELEFMGFDPVTIQNQINAERIQLADLSMRRGQNPAQAVYEFAKMRGYAPKQTPAPNAGQGDGQQQQQSAQQQVTGAERLAALEAGQEAGQSISQGRGNAPRPLTATRLLEMSEAEFDKMLRTPEGRALMGA
ncbi:MAG TPA: hypothetical protein VG897_13695, partial [Terriglobales bacterium]|nr:hypothetical protein [Terriglobales bacterium]